jgi:alpha-L-fucosidase 2
MNRATLAAASALALWAASTPAVRPSTSERGLAAGHTANASLDCLPLEPRNHAGNFIVPDSIGDVVYRRVGKGATKELALDAYRSPDGRHRPGVIVVHGGEFSAGSRVSFVGQLLETLTNAGYAWVSVDYRLGGVEHWRDAVDDVKAAVAFVMCHADALRIDRERLAILGEDAGGTIAAHVAAASPTLRGLVVIGGLFDLTAHGAFAAHPKAAGAVSLLGEQGPLVRPAVPTLLIHGMRDDEVPPEQPEAWCEGLNVKMVHCTLEQVAGAIHRLENWRPSEWHYKTRLVNWLGETLGRGRPPSTREPKKSRTGLLKNLAFDEGTGLSLDAWIPASSVPKAAVVLVHGGGWEAGDKVTYITPLFEPLAQAGFAWFSIDYRLTPAVEHPAQLDDLRRAVAYVRGHATEFGIDPKRLILVGESASGQMVAQIATEDRALSSVVSFYGVYDFLPFADEWSPTSIPVRLFRFKQRDAAADETLRRYSPLYHVHAKMPPLLLVHGTNERLWAQGQAMDRALAGVGARHELLAIEGAPHGMENWEGRPEWDSYKDRVVRWIKRVTAARGGLGD